MSKPYWVFELFEPLRYNGEETMELPVEYYDDDGGSWVVRCPSGAYRSLGKDEVRNVRRHWPD